MKKSLFMMVAVLVIGIATTNVYAQVPDTTKKMKADTTFKGDVVAALNANQDYTTAALAVKTANLEPVLKTGGPYTIFAPNNAAFSALPAGQLDSLMKDSTKLATLIKGHIVTGHYNKAEIIKALTDGKGKATFNTLGGGTLMLGVNPQKKLQLTAADGSTAEVILYDLVGTNGVVNGINGILK
jgi:uncharacterized surface protein with fasciclin (FAS1) repeats